MRRRRVVYMIGDRVVVMRPGQQDKDVAGEMGSVVGFWGGVTHVRLDIGRFDNGEVVQCQPDRLRKPSALEGLANLGRKLK